MIILPQPNLEFLILVEHKANENCDGHDQSNQFDVQKNVVNNWIRL